LSENTEVYILEENNFQAKKH